MGGCGPPFLGELGGELSPKGALRGAPALLFPAQTTQGLCRRLPGSSTHLSPGLPWGGGGGRREGAWRGTQGP